MRLDISILIRIKYLCCLNIILFALYNYLRETDSLHSRITFVEKIIYYMEQPSHVAATTFSSVLLFLSLSIPLPPPLFQYPKSPDLAALSNSLSFPPLGVSHIIRHPRKSGAHPVHRMHPGRQQWTGFCAIMLLGDHITGRYDLARFQHGSPILSRTRMDGRSFSLSTLSRAQPVRNYRISHRSGPGITCNYAVA